MNKQVRDTYNKLVGEKLHGDYEYDRWFKNPGLKAGYDMTKDTIEEFVLPEMKKMRVKKIFELGPGAGTWTELILGTIPATHLDLLDISREMLKVSKNRLNRLSDKIDFIEADFLDYEVKERYDAFFSCRVLEYLNDKAKAVKKISELLIKDGQGYIITKTPHYFRQKIAGRKLPLFHQGQISPQRLKKLLQQQGMRNIRIYPVTMHLCLFNIIEGNRFLYKMFGKKPLNWFSQFFSESYLVKFKKE